MSFQVYPFAELSRDKSRQYTEPKPDPIQERTVNWWLVQSANALGHPIEGWVRESNHKGGVVTREFSRKWIDFRCIEDAHDATHTIFADSAGWIDYASHADVADAASRLKLSPLMLKVYDALFTRGDGRQAAVELCSLSKTERGGYPWLVQAASRLIVKHESEWANPAKWKKLIAELDQRTGPKPQREEEQKRIEKLAWWDAVKASVPGFLTPDVFHVHPIGLVTNFKCNCNCINVESFLQAYETQHVLFESGTRPLDAVSKENLRALVQGILDYYNEFENKKCNIPCVAYMLATARLETKKYHKASKCFIYFEPTTENGERSYFDKYDSVLAETERYRQRARANGNTEEGDGYTYRGRGYVQVTWKRNYQAIGERLQIDLVSEPDRMLEPEIAAWATVYGMEKGLFTGKKLADYIDQERQDYINARKIINGLDQAELIAAFAIRFNTILESARC